MAKPVRVDLDFESTAKVVNLPAPTAAGDAATKAYVDAAGGGVGFGVGIALNLNSFFN